MTAPLAVLLLIREPSRRDIVVAAGSGAVAAWFMTRPALPFGDLENGWVSIVAGALLLAGLRRPQRFLETALLAVALAALAASLLFALAGLSRAELEWAAARRFGSQARVLVAALAAAAGGGTSGTLGALAEVVEESTAVGVRLASRLLPALVLMQTLAALALAWSLYQRLASSPRGAPLGRLRDFSFNDHLVWGVVVALGAVVIARPPDLGAIGGNLLVFLGGLYVVRGVAVGLWLVAGAGLASLPAALLGALAALVFAPLVVLLAFAVGLSDTWVNWRRRLAAAGS